MQSNPTGEYHRAKHNHSHHLTLALPLHFLCLPYFYPLKIRTSHSIITSLHWITYILVPLVHGSQVNQPPLELLGRAEGTSDAPLGIPPHVQHVLKDGRLVPRRVLSVDREGEGGRRERKGNEGRWGWEWGPTRIRRG